MSSVQMWIRRSHRIPPAKTRRGVTTRNRVRAWDATTAATHGENICAWTGVAAAAAVVRLGHAVMRAL